MPGPPMSTGQHNAMNMKTTSMAPISASQGPPALGTASMTPNGHPPHNTIPSSINGASPPGPPAIDPTNQRPGFANGPPSGTQNHIGMPPVSSSPQMHTPNFPTSGIPAQNSAMSPPTGMAPGNIRPGPPMSHIPYSPASPINNNQMGATRPPMPGTLGGPQQLQQSPHGARPINDMSQTPGRPPMMGMPPMPQTYNAGSASMPPPPGPMMPPMPGQGGMRPPVGGGAPPSSMGGYAPHPSGINSSSTVRKYSE